MNLKERIVINDDHFHVLSIDEKRKLYYGCTFFKDSKNTIPKMEEIQYWDSKNRKEISRLFLITLTCKLIRNIVIL